MKYYEVKFNIKTPEIVMQDARDIVSALAGEAGFESFEDTVEGVTGYVQQSLFNQPLLKQLIADFPLPDCDVTFSVSEADDRDWNEQWEQEGFEPIEIDSRCVIHDGRHLPKAVFPLSIEIDAHLAFGTGTHETTRMMVSSILDLNLKGCRVLDCGTGTGILAITALKHGADEAIGYDIDEWSVDNARHNAVINQVDDRFTSLQGDSSLLLETISGCFHVVMANINRNILLSDLPRFRSKMFTHGKLLLSGFYTDDIGLLIDAAREQKLELTGQHNEGNWACLILTAL